MQVPGQGQSTRLGKKMRRNTSVYWSVKVECTDKLQGDVRMLHVVDIIIPPRAKNIIIITATIIK